MEGDENLQPRLLCRTDQRAGSPRTRQRLRPSLAEYTLPWVGCGVNIQQRRALAESGAPARAEDADCSEEDRMSVLMLRLRGEGREARGLHPALEEFSGSRKRTGPLRRSEVMEPSPPGVRGISGLYPRSGSSILAAMESINEHVFADETMSASPKASMSLWTRPRSPPALAAGRQRAAPADEPETRPPSLGCGTNMSPEEDPRPHLRRGQGAEEPESRGKSASSGQWDSACSRPVRTALGATEV